MSPRAWIELIVLSFIWGGTFLSVRIALDDLGPLWVVAHRVFWAAVILWAVVLATGGRVPLTARVWIGFLGMGLLNNVFPFTLQAWGQLHIESGLTSILNAGTAIWGALVAALFLADERLTLRKSVGVLVGFFGVATAIGLSNLMAFDLRSLGQLAVVLSTISYAFAGVWGRRMLGRLSPVVSAAGMLLMSSVTMIPIAWVVEGPLVLTLAADTILALAYVTVVATAGAYLLYYRVLGMAGSSNVMLCTLLIAPVAIVLGALFLGEDLAPRAFWGFGILALGLLILNGTVPLPGDAKRAAQKG
ncbi:MAG: DMT family transporter [Pseudomonadota bacterium]